MPRVTMSVAHQLGQEEAIRRLKERSAAVKDAARAQVSDMQDSWEGNRLTFSFSAMGVRVKGTMNVEPSAVKIDAEVPLVAMMFKKMVEQRVTAELGQLLS